MHDAPQLNTLSFYLPTFYALPIIYRQQYDSLGLDVHVL